MDKQPNSEIQTVQSTGQKLTDLLTSFSQNKVLAERAITFDSIVGSSSPSVMKMRNDDYGLLLKFVIMVLTDYLNYAHPHMIGAVNTLASDLIESCPEWKGEDFINLCKYFRQNPNETYGQMTPEKFMLRLCEYREHRAQALEQHHAKKLGEMKEADKTLEKVNKNILAKFDKGKLPINDLGMGEEFERTQARKEREGRHMYPQVNHQRFFEK